MYINITPISLQYSEKELDLTDEWDKKDLIEMYLLGLIIIFFL